MTDKELERALSEYVTTSEAAELMGMWVRSVRNLIKAERLKAVRVGRDWLVSKASISEYLKTKSTKGRPTKAKPRKMPS